MRTSWPWRSETCGSAARTVCQVPIRLTSTTFSHSSGAIARVVVTVGGAIPALATATSSAAEALDRLGDRGEHRPRVGDVGADPDRPLADPLGRLARLVGVEVDDRDRGAAHVELPGALVADPARARR